MIHRHKIQNEDTKEVLIAVGKSVGLFEAMGYTEVGEVEQAYDGRYYVAGYAPKIPAEELEARRLAEAKRIRAEQVGTIIVEVDGMPFDGGEHAQARMANAIKASEILGKLFKSTLNNRLHRNLACVIDKSSRGAKLERAFEELPWVARPSFGCWRTTKSRTSRSSS